jgi:hypothetical protein
MRRDSNLVWRGFVASLALAAILNLTGVALAGSEDPTFVPPNWHIHDGNFISCPNPANPNDPWCQHKPIGFFWKTTGDGILNPNFPTQAAYVVDPARCPNAVDKAFVPSAGKSKGIVLRAGDCFTASLVIHLRTVPLGTGGPDGWSGPILTSERACLDVNLCPLESWETWFLVTSR